MAWKNTVTININEMGDIKGDCLRNTRVAASPDIPHKYDFALQAAEHAILHPMPAPGGVNVPLYLDFWATIDGVYQNWGHVGWQTPDGKFHSDGNTYDSVYAYMNSGHSPRNPSWGELLEDVRVVEWVADPPKPTGRSTLHLDRGTITTTFDRNGNKVGSIYARDDSYNYTVREDLGNRVKINSASGGGDGVYVYLNYSKDGSVIPGRHLS